MPVIRDFPAPTSRHVSSNPLKIFRWARRLVVPLTFLAFVIIYKLDVKYYISLTLEDNIVEWLTFGLLLGSGLLALFLAARTFGQARRPAIFFGIFGLCCVLFAFEEISWGQRVLRIKSPSFFLENSSQREINVHNVIQKKFHIKTKHIAGLTLFVYGVCLPLLITNRRIERFFTRCGLVIPPITLSFSFFIASIMMFDWPTGQEEELGELFFSACFFFFILGEYLQRAPALRPR